MQNLGASDIIARQVLRADAACCRARPHIGEDVSIRPVGDEIDAGTRVGAANDAGRVNAVFGPKTHEAIAELIRAEPREVADRGTSPGGRYGAVRRVAAMAKEIVALVVDLVELHQGFAQADDVRRLLRHFRSVRTLRDLPSASLTR